MARAPGRRKTLAKAILGLCLPALCGRIVGSGELFAQPPLQPAPNSDLRTSFEEAWRWARFSTASGLPSNSVHDLVETPDGTVWAATSRGLAWFDGYRWTPAGRAEGIPNQAPDAIAPLRRDEIVAVHNRRLYRGGREGFHPVEISIGGETLQALTVSEAASGEIYVLVTADRQSAAETLVYDGRSFRWVLPRLPVTGDQEASRLWSNGSGALWLSTDDGLQRWEHGEWRPYIPGVPGNHIDVSMLVESGTDQGLASIADPARARGIWEWSAGEAPHHNPSEPADLFESMDISRRGDAVVLYRSGDVRIRQNGRWSRIEIVPPPMAGALFVKFRDDGDLWVGTQHGLYLFRATSQRWTHWQVPSPDSRNEVLEILPTRDGSLWLATGRGVAIHRPDGSVDWIARVNGTELHQITGLAEDRHGGIWISSGSALDGAYRWDGERWQHFGEEHGLAAPFVHKIRKDRSGRLWFLGMAPMTGVSGSHPEPGAYLLKDDGTGPWTGDVEFEPWTPAEGLVHGRVYDFAEGRDGSRWFATYGGLSRWREGTWTHWTTDNGLKKNRIFTLAVDDAGGLWFGDQASGLGYIDNAGRPRYFSSADGLIHDEVQELRIAPDGALWISTRGGLARLRDGEWLSFDMTTGLSTPILWPILPLEDRVIVGTSGRGVDVLSLDEAAGPGPRVILDDPVVDLRASLLRWSAFAPWGQLAPESILTRYRFDHGEWSSWSTHREARLTGVSPGQHTFEVQARGLFGGSEDSAGSIVFSTPLPLYRQPTFYTPVGTLLLLVLALLESRRRHRRALRLRNRDDRRRLEERVAERTEALRESEERLRLLLETVQVIPWVADAATGVFSYVGPQAVDVLGYPIEDWFEPTFWGDHIHPDDAPAAIAYCAAQSAVAERYEFEYRMVAADGTTIWLHDLVAVVREKGKPTMLRGFMIDITSRKQAEAERLEAESEALEHRERLAHLSRVNMLGEMATGIAHEVNQPLTAVSTYTQACRRMIEAGLIDQDQIIEVLGRISDEAVRAGDMIHGLKALVRKRNSELRVCSVNRLVREVIPLADVEARALGIDIHLDLAADIPEVVADEVQVQQVVLNLIRNAIEATEPGGNRVEVRTTREEDMIEVAVTDHGAGAKGVDPEQFFQPFFSTKQEGMGMGLSISRSIVEAHGGTLGYLPGGTGGSTFFFRLPAQRQRVERSRSRLQKS